MSFNPRARKGRDSRGRPSRCSSRCFNPRARKGRDEYCEDCRAAHKGFNPRARKGRDSRGRPSRCSSRCFNPRARKGRDTSLSKYTASPTCFNPRARKGRDGWRGAVHGPGRVSIHAPARGATVAEFALAIVSLFQSTRPQGARLLDEMDIAIEQLFQSTRPQGARRSESPSSPAPTRFNPRARKGRDSF